MERLLKTQDDVSSGNGGDDREPCAHRAKGMRNKASRRDTMRKRCEIV